MAQINLLGSNIASPRSPLFLRQRLESDQTTPLRGFVCLQPNGGARRAGPLLRIVNEKVVVSIDLNAEGSRRTTSSAEKWETAKRQGVVNPVTTVKSDPVYGNRLVNMFVNRVMKNGKKSLAYKIMYRALRRIQQKTETKPLLVLRQAIRQVTPDVAVKARRVGGSGHQVPIEVGSAQGKALAIRWLLGASRKRRGRDMVLKLSSELVDAANGSGDAVRKKEETHRMAEANRAFAHIR